MDMFYLFLNGSISKQEIKTSHEIFKQIYMHGISLQITNILYFSLFSLEFLSVIFIEIGSNTFKTNFLPRIWESSGVTEVKV